MVNLVHRRVSTDQQSTDRQEARHPRTGELLSTVKFMMQNLIRPGR